MHLIWYTFKSRPLIDGVFYNPEAPIVRKMWPIKIKELEIRMLRLLGNTRSRVAAFAGFSSADKWLPLWLHDANHLFTVDPPKKPRLKFRTCLLCSPFCFSWHNIHIFMYTLMWFYCWNESLTQSSHSLIQSVQALLHEWLIKTMTNIGWPIIFSPVTVNAQIK